MNVTIAGTGNMARAIATRALAGGHGDEAANAKRVQLVQDGGLRAIDARR